MIIKLDNRECDLIPLIERRVEAMSILEEEECNKNSKTVVKNKSPSKSIRGDLRNNGCLVPLHIFQNVDVVGDANTDVAGDAGEIEKIHKIKKIQLPIGDVVLEDNLGNTILIFERKTLYDLAASIKDGRYNEQSFRLDKENIHNHNIVYIIEGDIERYNEKRGRIMKKVLISSMFSLMYYKGFSVMRTNSICETADVIVYFADKYEKTSSIDKNRKAYYSSIENSVIQNKNLVLEESESKSDDNEDEKYCGVFKSHKEKNEYITPDNISIIMLSCIPGISSKIATQIMREYKTIKNLLYQLDKDANCLNTFMIKTEKGTLRKINKTCVDNIKKFLVNTNSGD
jgi:ERCC4-type nuclease